MHQISEKIAMKAAFERVLELKGLQVAKLENMLKQEKDGHLISIFERILREEAHHVNLLSQKFAELGLA